MSCFLRAVTSCYAQDVTCEQHSRTRQITSGHGRGCRSHSEPGCGCSPVLQHLCRSYWPSFMRVENVCSQRDRFRALPGCKQKQTKAKPKPNRLLLVPVYCCPSLGAAKCSGRGAGLCSVPVPSWQGLPALLPLPRGIAQPGCTGEWAQLKGSSALFALGLRGSRTGPASNPFILSMPSRAIISVVWAKIKNHFQDRGVHPKNTHFLPFL